MNEQEVKLVIIDSLKVVRETINEKGVMEIKDETPLLGGDAILDSLGLVTLIIEIEQRLNEKYEHNVTLADERAMSQRKSPFRSVQSLTDYIITLIKEELKNE